MTHEFQSWDSVVLATMSDRISRVVVTGEKAMVAQVFLKKAPRGGDPSARAAERYARGDKLPSSSNVSFHHERPSKGAKQP